MYWQAYFSIYPFTQDREDQRNAQLISYLTYISSLAAQNKGLKKPIPMTDLLPDYLGERKKHKNTEQMRAEMHAWYAMYKAKEAQAKGKHSGA